MQHRRAQYYLLRHEKAYVNKMLHHGQIEDKDAKTICGEIDDKIFKLQMQPTEIKLLDFRDRICQLTELSEIFTKEEIEACIGDK